MKLLKVLTGVVDKLGYSSRVNEEASTSGHFCLSQPLRMTRCSRRVVSQPDHY